MTTADDPYDLQRFLTAQEGTYDRALAELRRGRKTSHWMWFVFPQVQGLGRSATAQRYALTGLEEARAYLAHPVLGPRLHECVDALLSLRDGPGGHRPEAADVLDADAVKLRSSMTLFARAAADDDRFQRVLDEYFAGEPDGATLDRL